MNSVPHKIIMTNPCHANWEEMAESSKGKFCAGCQTDVIDFTRMSETEIIGYFKDNKITKGCGRFYKRQLDTIQIPVDEQIFSYDLKQWQKFLVVILFCFGQELFQVQLVFAQETTSDSTIVSEGIDSSFVELDSIDLTNEIDTIITEPKQLKVDSQNHTFEFPFVLGDVSVISGGFGIGDQNPIPECLKPTEPFCPEITETERLFPISNQNKSIISLKNSRSKDNEEKNDQTENHSMILPNLITFRKTRRKKK